MASYQEYLQRNKMIATPLSPPRPISRGTPGVYQNSYTEDVPYGGQSNNPGAVPGTGISPLLIKLIADMTMTGMPGQTGVPARDWYTTYPYAGASGQQYFSDGRPHPVDPRYAPPPLPNQPFNTGDMLPYKMRNYAPRDDRNKY